MSTGCDPHPREWNGLNWPAEYPLALHELAFLLPYFLKEGRGRLDVYVTRVYNPVWTKSSCRGASTRTGPWASASPSSRSSGRARS